MTEWQLYAQEVEGDTWQGRKLDKAKLDKMNGVFGLLFFTLSFYLTGLIWIDQQIGQLYELMQAIKNKSEGNEEDQ